MIMRATLFKSRFFDKFFKFLICNHDNPCQSSSSLVIRSLLKFYCFLFLTLGFFASHLALI